MIPNDKTVDEQEADKRATSRGVSLFPHHYQIVALCAEERRLHSNTFSPAIQFIIEEWRDQRDMLNLLSEATRSELRRQVQQLRKESNAQPHSTV